MTTISKIAKRAPILASCDYFGTIERGMYKEHTLSNPKADYRTVFQPFAWNYIDAVNSLHEWIQENAWCIDEYPKCKFELFKMTNRLDKHGDYIRVRLYSITANKAKMLLFSDFKTALATQKLEKSW